MKKTSIQIAYDGTAIETGSMDVRDLAPALLAIGDVLQECNRELYGDASKVSVYVKSDFEKGSFQIDLEVVLTLAEQLALVIKGEPGPDAARLAALIGFGAGGTFLVGKSLFSFIKWLRGRKIKSTTVIDNGLVKIETQGDYDAIEVSSDVVALYKNPKLRKSLADVLKPLKRKGIEVFEARSREGVLEKVEKGEVYYFETNGNDECEVVENCSILHLRLLGISFESGRKWELTDGERKIKASIRDESFLSEINDGSRSFTKGDVLKVELVSRQTLMGSGLKAEHDIVRVLEHKVGPSYRQLGFDDLLE